MFLAEKESSFNPYVKHKDGEVGIYGVSRDALNEVSKYYPDVSKDFKRLHEIDYNTLIACKFLYICHELAGKWRPAFFPNAPRWYKTLMIYTDWLTWHRSTYKYADWIYTRYAKFNEIDYLEKTLND